MDLYKQLNRDIKDMEYFARVADDESNPPSARLTAARMLQAAAKRSWQRARNAETRLLKGE